MMHCAHRRRHFAGGAQIRRAFQGHGEGVQLRPPGFAFNLVFYLAAVYFLMMVEIMEESSPQNKRPRKARRTSDYFSPTFQATPASALCLQRCPSHDHSRTNHADNTDVFHRPDFRDSGPEGIIATCGRPEPAFSFPMRRTGYCAVMTHI